MALTPLPSLSVLDRFVLARFEKEGKSIFFWKIYSLTFFLEKRIKKKEFDNKGRIYYFLTRKFGTGFIIFEVRFTHAFEEKINQRTEKTTKKE